MNIPQDLKFTKNDEWVRIEGNIATIGISDYAQEQLSDIVFIEYSVNPGDTVKQAGSFGTVESVKAASDVYSPVSGKVVEVNEGLLDAPETVNSDPYGKAWMIKVEFSDSNETNSLLDAKGYEASVKERES